VQDQGSKILELDKKGAYFPMLGLVCSQCWPQYEKYDIPNIGGSKYCRNIGLDILYYRDIKVPISYCSAIYC
jgi:hypothetical protein